MIGGNCNALSHDVYILGFSWNHISVTHLLYQVYTARRQQLEQNVYKQTNQYGNVTTYYIRFRLFGRTFSISVQVANF